MDTDKLSTLFDQNNQKEYITLISQALTNIQTTIEAEIPAVTSLQQKIQENKSYNDQIRAQINGPTKKIDWNRDRTLLNRNDVEKIWDGLDKSKLSNTRREDVYKMYSEHSGEYISGLKKDITEAELQTLVSNNQNTAYESMGSNKRKRFADEIRCVQKQNGEIHWYSTLEAIKKLATDNRYTNDLIYETIIDIAKEYLPDYDRYFRTLTLDELTEHLIEQDPITYEESLYLKPLKSLVRKEGVPLNKITKNAEKLYKLSIKKPNATCDENNVNFDQSLLQFNIDALVKLTDRKISETIKKHIHQCKTKGTSFKYKDLLHYAMQMEDENPELRPKTDMKLDYMTPNELSIKINNINIKEKTYDSSESETDEEMFKNRERNKPVPPTFRPTSTNNEQTVQHRPPTPADTTKVEKSERPTKYEINNIKLTNRTEKDEFSQAAEDYGYLIDFYEQRYNELVPKIKQSIGTLMNDNNKSMEEVFKSLIERMKKK